MSKQESSKQYLQSHQLIGLTGGIGSGKSTVAAMLVKLGCGLIDADQLSREAVAPGSKGLQLVVDIFSEEVLTAEGTLDRRKLRGIVFKDESLRKKLNQVLHPEIHNLLDARIEEYEKMGYQWLIYDAALLVETGTYREMKALIVTYLPVDLQRMRVAARENTDLREVDRIIASQMTLEEKAKFADYLIDNSGDLESTQRQVDKVYKELTERFGECRVGALSSTEET